MLYSLRLLLFFFLKSKDKEYILNINNCISSVTELWHPMDCSMPGFPVHHQRIIYKVYIHWGWGREMESCIVDTRFQFVMMKKFWRLIVAIVASQVRVLNGTELYTLKWLNGKFYVLCVFSSSCVWV